VKRRWNDVGARVSDEEADVIVEAARADYVRVLDTVLNDQADLACIYAKYGREAPACW
jgi:hypothetical protein